MICSVFQTLAYPASGQSSHRPSPVTATDTFSMPHIGTVSSLPIGPSGSLPWPLPPQPSSSPPPRGCACLLSLPCPPPLTQGPQSPVPSLPLPSSGPTAPVTPVLGQHAHAPAPEHSTAGPRGTCDGTPTLASPPHQLASILSLCRKGVCEQDRLEAGGRAEPAAVPPGRGGRPFAASFPRSPRFSSQDTLTAPV